MPSLGADMDEGTLQEWLVRSGDQIHKGDPIAVVETAKSMIEVECFETGTIGELLVEPGTTVPVGTALALIEPAPQPSKKREKRAKAKRTEKAEEKRPTRPAAPHPTPPSPPEPGHVPTPSAAHERGHIEAAPCSGTSRSEAASSWRPSKAPASGGASPEPNSSKRPRPPGQPLRSRAYGPRRSPEGSPPNWRSTWRR